VALLLAIESSCDETGIALYDSAAGLLAHALHSQVAMHAEYGGVVPELASRDHIRRVVPLLRETLTRAAWASREKSAPSASPRVARRASTPAVAGRETEAEEDEEDARPAAHAP
jgi:hypothetical protein